jgi:phage terminase large subunit
MKRFNIARTKFLECYWHLLDQTKIFDIDFLYGGRDSGKSRFVAMILILDCMRVKGFKCLLVRKNLNTVRGSQFDLIKSIIEEWGLTGSFRFNETRLEIIFKQNGNGFYGRGLDDPGKIKSFNNPSCCWVEEGNQIEKDDFVIILTSLRTQSRVKTWFTFNPECEMNYTDFWLWQEYFSHTTELNFTWNKIIEIPDLGPVEFNVRATQTTYRDNPYCQPQRKALYESYKASKNNAYWYQTYTLGLWGYKRTGGEFWKCFEEAKHAAREIDITNGTIHLVADNNVNPYIAISVWQIFPHKKLIRQIHEFPCESPDNTAKKAALKALRWLRAIGYAQPVYVYGDPSANAKSTTDDNGASFFDKFTATIREDGLPLINRVQKSAPEVAMSGSFVNEIYESNYGGWTIEISSTCRKSIEDYTMAKEDAEGKILKKRETDKDTKVSFERYGHFSDCKRYFITTVLKNEFIQYKSRSKKYYGIAT